MLTPSGEAERQFRAGAIWGKRKEGSTDGRADEDSDREAELNERRESVEEVYYLRWNREKKKKSIVLVKKRV